MDNIFNLLYNIFAAQIGKQFIMVPSSGSSKIKLVPASGSMSDVQYIRADSDHVSFDIYILIY